MLCAHGCGALQTITLKYVYRSRVRRRWNRILLLISVAETRERFPFVAIQRINSGYISLISIISVGPFFGSVCHTIVPNINEIIRNHMDTMDQTTTNTKQKTTAWTLIFPTTSPVQWLMRWPVRYQLHFQMFCYMTMCGIFRTYHKQLVINGGNVILTIISKRCQLLLIVGSRSYA